MFNKFTGKITALVIIAMCMISCEGSRPRRMYEAGKTVYKEYEETGDPTMLILFIVCLLVIGGLWLWNKNNKNKDR